MVLVMIPLLMMKSSLLKKDKQEAILLISSLNEELSRIDELSCMSYNSKSQKFEDENIILKDEIERLKIALASVSNETSVSPSCEVFVLNETIEKLHTENNKLNEIIKELHKESN